MAQNLDPNLNGPHDQSRNRNFNDVSPSNDDLGENTEQTPVARAQNGPEGRAGNSERDERIPSVTPYNENGLPGPDDEDEDDDTLLDDDDDDDYEEIIPIEGDDDDLEDDYDDDEIVDRTDDTNIDISRVGGDATDRRPGSRTSGRMIDHEPGIDGTDI